MYNHLSGKFKNFHKEMCAFPFLRVSHEQVTFGFQGFWIVLPHFAFLLGISDRRNETASFLWCNARSIYTRGIECPCCKLCRFAEMLIRRQGYWKFQS